MPPLRRSTASAALVADGPAATPAKRHRTRGKTPAARAERAAHADSHVVAVTGFDATVADKKETARAYRGAPSGAADYGTAAGDSASAKDDEFEPIFEGSNSDSHPPTESPPRSSQGQESPHVSPSDDEASNGSNSPSCSGAVAEGSDAD